MPSTPRLLAVAFALVASLALAVQAAAEPPTFTVTLADGRIDPPRLEVPAGTRIKLVLRNAGPGAAEFEGRDVRVEKVLAPDAASFVVLPALEPGTYRFFDEFHPDNPDMRVMAR